MSISQNGASSQPRNYQFRLRYLFYLVTLTALGCSALRYAFGLSVDMVFRSVITVYVVCLIAYLAFRFPRLLRRLADSRQRLRSRRSELKDFVNEVRNRPKAP